MIDGHCMVNHVFVLFWLFCRMLETSFGHLCTALVALSSVKFASVTSLWIGRCEANSDYSTGPITFMLRGLEVLFSMYDLSQIWGPCVLICLEVLGARPDRWLVGIQENNRATQVFF